MKRPPSKPAGPPAPRRPLAFPLAVAGVLAVLLATAGERTLGLITDEQEMLSTAVAVAELGEIGIARGQHFALERPGGDALSPYGMGLPLVEAPVTLLASPFERAFGARTSQALLALLASLLVTAASAGAGLLARALGASPPGEALAVLATGLGSPLWAYASTAFSEPLQAACLALAAAAAASSARAAQRPLLLLAAAAGLLAGWAVLTKSLNLATAPLCLLPLVLDGPEGPWSARLRRVGAAAAGAAFPLALWLAFELVRFGRPLSSYGDQGFTHPFLDGLWRLLVGANKGLLVYFPLALVAAAGLARLARTRPVRGSLLAIGGVTAILVSSSASWWAWDGTVGWGPRLLVPAVPLLAAAAAAGSEGSRPLRRLAAALVVAGAAVNLLGALQPDAAATAYVDSAGPVRLDEAQAALYPRSLSELPGEDRLLVRRSVVSSLDAAFSPVRVHAFLLATRLRASSRADAEERLSRPPWLASHPGARPVLVSARGTHQEILVNVLATPFAWPHLGAVVGAGEEERRAGFNGAWDLAMGDQVGRALDTGRGAAAVRLATRLHAAAPSALTAALRAEALRVAGRREEAVELLASLPDLQRASPLVSLAEALLQRDLGNGARARLHLEEAASRYRNEAIRRALTRPPEEWPSLRGFLAPAPAPRSGA